MLVSLLDACAPASLTHADARLAPPQWTSPLSVPQPTAAAEALAGAAAPGGGGGGALAAAQGLEEPAVRTLWPAASLQHELAMVRLLRGARVQNLEEHKGARAERAVAGLLGWAAAGEPTMAA